VYRCHDTFLVFVNRGNYCHFKRRTQFVWLAIICVSCSFSVNKFISIVGQLTDWSMQVIPVAKDHHYQLLWSRFPGNNIPKCPILYFDMIKRKFWYGVIGNHVLINKRSTTKRLMLDNNPYEQTVDQLHVIDIFKDWDCFIQMFKIAIVAGLTYT